MSRMQFIRGEIRSRIPGRLELSRDKDEEGR
jgi:hypothetical protein